VAAVNVSTDTGPGSLEKSGIQDRSGKLGEFMKSQEKAGKSVVPGKL